MLIVKINNMKTEKYLVCPYCFDEPHNSDCHCTYTKVKGIMLEFEVCECCNRRMDYHKDSEYNNNLIDSLDL